MTARKAALEEAAAYAEFYAEERMAMCGDAILFDPILSGGRFTAANVAKSQELQVDSTINSAGYHAALAIAAHLRELAKNA